MERDLPQMAFFAKNDFNGSQYWKHEKKIITKKMQ